MIDLKKFRLDKTLLIVMLVLMAGYHFFVYFNAPWEIYYDSIHQIRNNNLIVIGCSFFAFFAMFILVAYLLFMKRYPIKILIPIMILFLFGVFWVAYIVVVDNVSVTLLLRDSFPPFSLIAAGIILIGYEDKWWEIIKKALLIISIVFSLYSFGEIILAFYRFGFNYRITYGAPMYLYIIGLFATYAVVTITDDWIKNRKLILLLVVVLLFFNSAILQGRSWFLQTTILFIIYIIRIRNFYSYDRGLRMFIPFSIFLVTVIIFVSNIELFEGLIHRFSTSGDTRTYQLETFFEQVSFDRLLIGGGTKAGYLFNDDPNFHFVDNQVILYMFRYGIIPTIAYLFLIFYPIYKVFMIKNKLLMRKSFVLISWFAAMMGISVYFNITFGMAHMIVMLCTGRLFYEIINYKKVYGGE